MVINILIYSAILLLFLSNLFLFFRSFTLYTFYGFSTNNIFWYTYGNSNLISSNDISILFSTGVYKIQVTFVGNRFKTIIR
jgi:hypothetical protein